MTKQLGLKLEEKKRVVPVLVFDHMERNQPTTDIVRFPGTDDRFSAVCFRPPATAASSGATGRTNRERTSLKVPMIEM